MTTHRDSRFIRCAVGEVFDLVADVERYPDFLSLWRYAKIDQREGDIYWTDQEVGLGPIRERFRTRTAMLRPVRIEITSADAMFRTFLIDWEFARVRSGCRAAVALTWEMRSRPLQTAIQLLLPATARAMVDAFQHRAESLLR